MYIPEEVLTIIDTLEKNGHKAYMVGGCVRDMLLGLEPKDFDICTSARPEQVLKLFPRCIPTGLKHGTVTVIINSRPFEVTTFRIESEYTDHRRPDSVIFSDSLEEDLKRRDFTINAIAFHPAEGISDPFNGITDLKNGIIRTVGNPEDRFEEDALRMLRAIRFQARFGFAIEAGTFTAIKKHSGDICAVSRERILEELNRILLSPFPESFGNLLITGLYRHIFPDSDCGSPDLTHLKKLPEELPVRWAALLWLLNFHDSDIIRKICSDLKMSNKLKNKIVSISELLNTPLPENFFTLRKTLSASSTETFSHALIIMKILGLINWKEFCETKRAVNKIISEKHCLSLSDLAVTGRDLIKAGLSPGKQMGLILNTLFLCVLQKPELNRKDILISLAENIMKNYISANE